jgi:hypothetical protein
MRSHLGEFPLLRMFRILKLGQQTRDKGTHESPKRRLTLGNGLSRCLCRRLRCGFDFTHLVDRVRETSYPYDTTEHTDNEASYCEEVARLGCQGEEAHWHCNPQNSSLIGLRL